MLAKLAIRRPRAVIVAFALVTLLASPGLTRLVLRTDGNALVPEDAAEVIADRELRSRFDIRDRLALVVRREGDGGIFDPGALRLVDRLTRELAALDGLPPEDVTSLASEKSDAVFQGTLVHRTWLEPLPADAAQAEALRERLEGLGVYRGTLLSNDSPPSATAILVRTPPGDRTRFVRAVQEIARRHRGHGTDVRLLVVGAPVAESQLGQHVLEDLARLLPVALVALGAVFWLQFRCWAALLLPLLEIGSALILVFGTMGLCGAPVHLTTAVLPVILAATGITDEIHILTNFLARARGAGTARDQVLRTMRALGGEVVATSATTAVGFGAFVLSPLPPVRDFGLFMALGIVYCLAWSLLFVPAFLATAPPSAWDRGRGFRASSGLRLGRLLCTVGTWSFDRRRAVLLVLGALALPAFFLARRTFVDDSWLSGFSPSSELRRATDEVEAVFGGTHLLEIAVEGERIRAWGRLAGADLRSGIVRLPPDAIPEIATAGSHRLSLAPAVPGLLESPVLTAHILEARRTDEALELVLDPRDPDPVLRWPALAAEGSWRIDGADRCLQPAVLALVRELERALAEREELGVGRVLGPWEQLATANHLIRARKESERLVPVEPSLLEVLMWHFRRVRGKAATARLIEGDGRSVLITVFMRGATFARTSELLRWLRSYEHDFLSPAGLRLRFGGDVVVSQAVVEGIVSSQVRSLALGLLGVLASLTLLSGAPRTAWPCVIPAALAVLANLAFLGACSIPIGVATSMFSAITLGIGVDYAIHLTGRMRRSAARGSSPRKCVHDALLSVGPAIVLDTLAVSSAFGLLLFSSVPANRNLAALVLVGLLTSFLVTVTCLPALAALLVRRAHR